ncbi:MAG: 3'(2'),5'-bisphosphate nucleotidase CysQ [Alphaproteobacteria bacterium]
MADASPPSMILELRRLASRAGMIILQHYGSAVARRKDDSSPVTIADEEAERAIIEDLTALDPGIPIVAEETVARGAGPVIVGRRFWLVDPLDGTKEFLSRNGEFTVNVALIEDGLPTLGIVLAPALRVAYFSDGGRAWRAEGDGPAHPIRARAAPATGRVAAVSRSHLDAATEQFLARHGIRESRPAGSALKFGLLAAGEADVYPRFGRTMEWDTAAGHAVLRAAGGSVRDLDGRELRYGKPGFANPSFIARGRDA